MARFRSTPTSAVGNFSRSGDVAAPTPMSMKSAGVTTNAGSAAGAVSVGSIYGGLRDSAPKYGEIVATAERLAAEERIATEAAAANTEIAGINAEATVKSAKYQADAMKKQASASKTGSAIGAIGSIASAALPLMMSDETTKHTVDRIDDALETLRNLKPVTFFYKEEYSSSPERMHYGFIAQQYKEVMPDATYYDESIGKLCIDTTELIGLLVRANQQLETRLTRLEAKQALQAV
jgi:hypothetical protein